MTVELEPLQGRRINRVEQDELTGRSKEDAAWRDRSVGESREAMQIAECREQFEQQAERRVDAGRDARLDRSIEHLGQPSAGDELRDHSETTLVVELDPAWARESFIIERCECSHPLAEHLLEGFELRTQHEPFEHAARLAIEREDTAAKTVLVPRGGKR